MNGLSLVAACEDCGWTASRVGPGVTTEVAQEHSDQRGHVVRYDMQGRVLPTTTWRDARRITHQPEGSSLT